MTRHGVIIFLTLLLSNWNTYGHGNVDTVMTSGELSLRIKSLNFIKNNEYFSPITEGYTLLGFFLQPELVYSPSEKLTLRAGIHLLKYSGAKEFSQIRPVFSTTINLSGKTLLTIGSLSGSDKHRMFDPHFNKERLYNAYVEDGFQLTSMTNHIFNDAWLSWENFIFKGDTTREIFTFGESFKYKSSRVADFIEFEIPFQIQFKHFGGQISKYPEHVETLFNLATGLRINFDLEHKRLGQAGIEYLQFINNQLNGVSQNGISHGYASWFIFHYNYKVLFIDAGFWKGHNFYAPNGNTIFSSVSDYKANVIIPDRKIITNSFYLCLLPESSLKLFLGFDTYYDIDFRRIDNALTLHLNFDKIIKLVTIKH